MVRCIIKTTTEMELIQKVKQILIDNPKVVAVVLLAFLLTTILYVARAGAPFVAIEAETSASSQVIVKQSQSASGGAYAEFPAISPPSTDGPDYPGQPKPGTVLWGTSLGGQEDPYVKHEQPAGKRVGIRRTFQPSWSQRRIDNMVTLARGDLAVGRIPWVSIKPASWASMAAGNEDTLIDYMLTELDKLDGPVWLTVHHEPEGGGGVNAPDDPAGPAGHLAMNKRVRQRMTALETDNIALSLILMSWTWDSRSVPQPPAENHRDADLWWEDGVYDFLGIDHYAETGTLITSRWDDVRAWAYEKGVDIAVGEWGTTEETDRHIKDWHQHALDSASDTNRARIVGLSYWDNIVNTEGATDWRLTGVRLDAFREMIAAPGSILWGEINE